MNAFDRIKIACELGPFTFDLVFADDPEEQYAHLPMMFTVLDVSTTDIYVDVTERLGKRLYTFANFDGQTLEDVTLNEDISEVFEFCVKTIKTEWH